MSGSVDFKLLFERSTGLYLILDPALRIVAGTDAYCRAVGIEREALIGRAMFDVLTDDPCRPNADGVANTRASFERVLKLKRADVMAIQRYDMPTVGGGFVEKYWNPTNVPVLDGDSEVRWIIHRVHDVTRAVNEPLTDPSQERLARDQFLVIQRLRAATEELAQLDALRQGLLRMSRLNTVSMMASALAHDVSQPLTAAKNYLSTLRRNRAQSPAAADAQSDDLIAKIGLQIDRASEIVKGLRTFMSAGTTTHRPEDLHAVIGEAAKLADSVIKASGASLTLELSPVLPRIAMDRVQIIQVIVNLITNAAEAMQDQSDRRLTIAARKFGDGAVRVDIADTGPGLPEDVAKRLFEPFATTKAMGMGLGLPICRQIVKEHDGMLWAAANTPTGTIFSFTLPVADKAD